MSDSEDDFPYNLFGDDAARFIRHLYDLDAALWVAGPGWEKETEVRRPNGWQEITCTGNRERLETYDELDRPYVCVNTGIPFTVFDSDIKNGGDPEKVRAVLIELGERIYAEVDTPSGGKHFYVEGHRDLPTVRSKEDNPKLPDFPGLDIQSHRSNVFTPGTLRAKYKGLGYDVVFDELDQIVDAEPVYDDNGNETRPILDWLAEQLARGVKAKARKTSGGAKEWEWDPCEPWAGGEPDARQQKYLAAALTDEAAKVTGAKDHRNDALHEAALKMGSYLLPAVAVGREGDERMTDIEPPELGPRRKWIPDVKMMADQLIEDCSSGDVGMGMDVVGTIASWLETAKFHGEEFQEDDWIALVEELARRAAEGMT